MCGNVRPPLSLHQQLPWIQKLQVLPNLRFLLLLLPSLHAGWTLTILDWTVLRWRTPFKDYWHQRCSLHLDWPLHARLYANSDAPLSRLTPCKKKTSALLTKPPMKLHSSTKAGTICHCHWRARTLMFHSTQQVHSRQSSLRREGIPSIDKYGLPCCRSQCRSTPSFRRTTTSGQVVSSASTWRLSAATESSLRDGSKGWCLKLTRSQSTKSSNFETHRNHSIFRI